MQEKKCFDLEIHDSLHVLSSDRRCITQDSRFKVLCMYFRQIESVEFKIQDLRFFTCVLSSNRRYRIQDSRFSICTFVKSKVYNSRFKIRGFLHVLSSNRRCRIQDSRFSTCTFIKSRVQNSSMTTNRTNLSFNPCTNGPFSFLQTLFNRGKFNNRLLVIGRIQMVPRDRIALFKRGCNYFRSMALMSRVGVRQLIKIPRRSIRALFVDLWIIGDRAV